MKTKTDKPATFAEWMNQVNSVVLKKTGLFADDLPDYCYRDAYDDGESPGRTARAAIRAAKE